MRFKQVTSVSGQHGEQYKLRAPYANLDEFRYYANLYGLHTRIGYKTPESAWARNPTVQSSTVPSDFCRVDSRGRRYQRRT
jgi:hypothetical protein